MALDDLELWERLLLVFTEQVGLVLVKHKEIFREHMNLKTCFVSIKRICFVLANYSTGQNILY